MYISFMVINCKMLFEFLSSSLNFCICFSLNAYCYFGKLRQLFQLKQQPSTLYLFILIYIITFPLYAYVKLLFDPTENIWENFVPVKWDPL